jgi:hypothetical protein
MISTRKHLFIDDRVVERMDGLTRTFHPARKHRQNPILTPDKPWEAAMAYLYGSVIREKDGLFKMWYQVWENEGVRPNGQPGFRTCYATSFDGLNWRKPALGLYSDRGQDTNIVGPMTMPSVIEDLADPDPQRRYKMWAYDRGAYHVLFSPDGLSWSPYAQNPVVQGGDVAPCSFDEQTGQYMAFVKTHPTVGGRRRRSVGLSLSKDFTTWTPAETILTNDEADDAWAKERGYAWREIYGMAGFPYGGMYLGFAWLFNVWGEMPPGGTDDGTFDVELTYSYDGRAWQRYAGREPVLPRTPYAGLKPSIAVGGKAPEPDQAKGPRPFDCGWITTANRPLIVGDEIWLYYGGLNCTHGCKWYGEPENGHAMHGGATGLATWRLDGFVSLDAGPIETTLLTKPMICDGQALFVNADIHEANGALWVEVQDAAGETIPGYGMADSGAYTGDRTHHEITWQGHDLRALTGQEVRFIFMLRDADLYAFQLAEINTEDRLEVLW